MPKSMLSLVLIALNVSTEAIFVRVSVDYMYVIAYI